MRDRATTEELEIINRFMAGLFTEADVRFCYNGPGSWLANQTAIKHPETYKRLRQAAVELGILAAHPPKNREELEARQAHPNQALPQETAEETPEAEEPKAREIPWEQVQERAYRQMDAFALQQRIDRQREERITQ